MTSSLFAFGIKYFHSPRLVHTAISNSKARQVRSLISISPCRVTGVDHGSVCGYDVTVVPDPSLRALRVETSAPPAVPLVDGGSRTPTHHTLPAVHQKGMSSIVYKNDIPQFRRRPKFNAHCLVIEMCNHSFHQQPMA